MEDVLQLIAEVGLPIAGALISGFFIFLIIKQILGGVLGQIDTLNAFSKSLENRVQTMNNDIVKIDTLVSYAFNKQPNLDRLAANEGKEDARKD